MSTATIMVRLAPGNANNDVLSLASDVAARLGASRVIGIAACQPMQYFTGPDAYVPQDLIELDREQMTKDLDQAEKQFRAAFSRKNVQLQWRSSMTLEPLAGFLAAQMRAADLLVTAPSEASLFDNTRHVDLASLIMAAGRPVLVGGAHTSRLDLGQVLVAWKESREARRALEDALPVLKLAEKVTVVEIAPEEELGEAAQGLEDVTEWLKLHGISATPRALAEKGEDAARLADVADEMGAGLVVAGAYGHSRLAEWVLGDVTRDFLLNPPACSFVSH